MTSSYVHVFLVYRLSVVIFIILAVYLLTGSAITSTLVTSEDQDMEELRLLSVMEAIVRCSNIIFRVLEF